MTRAVWLVIGVLCLAGAVSAQQVSVLHITVQLVDSAGKPTPVSYHALLISDDPPTQAPRRVVAGADGTANVRLPPGRYVVESDKPVTFQGRGYHWTQQVTVAAGRDASLALNAQNAEGDASPAGSTLETDPGFLLNQWQHTVVGIWTPLAHGAGFVVDAARGLIATSASLVGSAAEVEAQFTPQIKVRARKVAADDDTGVAILQVNPSVVDGISPLAPECSPAQKAMSKDQELVAIAVPRRGETDIAFGAVTRVESRAIVSDLRVRPDGAGGPVFVGGHLAGLTALPTSDADEHRIVYASRVVGVDRLCAAMMSAATKLQDGAAPDATHLPVDPLRSVPEETLKPIVAKRAGSLSPTQVSSTDFDIAFITPVNAFGARESAFAGSRQRVGPGFVDVGSPAFRPVRDFANWSDYVEDDLPVLLVRVTPKLAESKMTAFARGAARTQGVPVPAMKRPKAKFVRLRAFCGEQEVTPIHPFVIEQHVSPSDVIEDGLYVFAPDALGPKCGSVKLTVYSEKPADRGDSVEITPSTIQNISRDFDALRAAAPAAPQP